ncbi:hypothetical protein HHK36_019456 [Tetracentron sinense]|uniref:CCHC-type domain-containing protein n=1 Tax=Tetracentron sinense TaxID=13715 RepID=A0A835D962_TETSI|nr:hypothetical protein HHK36_019456 [Tetracentron sinense]
MAKGKKMKGNLDHEDEEETKKSVILLSSSDDEEANEDLSLKIVEKARMREAKRKRKEGDLDDFEVIDGVRSAAVIDISSSSEELEVVADPSGGYEEQAVPELRKKKKNKKKKKKNKMVEAEEITVNAVKEEEQMDTVKDLDTIKPVETESVEISDNIVLRKLLVNVVKEEEQMDTVKDLETIKPVETESVEISDNLVLRKLLRGPRYFDPPDSSWGMCFNCGEEGHTAVNCTSQKRRKPCFVCGGFEHSAKHCTQGHDCFICKRKGHRAKDCPEKHQGNSQSSKICLRCGDSGHDMFSCGNDYSSDDLKEIQCYICKTFGHLCCVDFLDTGPREASCYNCGQSGHTGLASHIFPLINEAFPLPIKQLHSFLWNPLTQGCAKSRGETSGAGPSTLCYRCGEEGHFARGCTSTAKAGRRMDGFSTPTRRFFKEDRDLLGFRSAPNKKKSTQYEERGMVTMGKSKWRGGWINDDPGDLPHRKSKGNVWSPVTPTKKSQQISALTAGNHLSSSRSPQKKSKYLPGTSSSHGSAKAYHQKFSASRFGSYSGSGARRNYDW